MKETRWTTLPADEGTVAHLQETLKIDRMFCRLLVQRGITNFEEAKGFFRPSLANLHDPFLMRDMDKAVRRLAQAIENQERILLYGDYDVDGTTSVALMYSWLSNFHQHLDYYLPDRDKEGYGISLAGVEYARQTACPLVIAMDCGIKSHEAVALANSYGIDFIICDHHLPEGELPDAFACIDPKRTDCDYPFKDLSGCGIAFKLAQAYAQQNNVPVEELEHLLDLVTVSIACDIVPMVGENRTIAHFGLQRLNREPRVGLWALIQRCGRSYPLTISDLVFGIGPLINAAGRISDAREAVKLMLSADKQSALDNAKMLVERNRTRREVDFETVKSARHRIASNPEWKDRKSIVLFDPDWHKGIIGIVASRLSEEFHRPTVILTQSEGRVFGSARSVPGFDLYAALETCEEFFISFGGHSHAAGMQMPPENVGLFDEKFEMLAKQNINREIATQVIEVAAPLDFEQIDEKFLKILKQFAPFGPQNMNPIFVTRNVVDSGKTKLLENNHVRFSVRQDGLGKTMSGIGFGLGKAFAGIKDKPFDIAFNLQEETWRGERVVSLGVKDVRLARK